MELHEALAQIAVIRQQVARTAVFRGYRAVPVAFSGVLAFATAAIQACWLPEPVQNSQLYLALWVGAAFLSVLASAIEMAWQRHRTPSALEHEKTLVAVGQFLPCLVAGGLLMLVLLHFAPESLWLLPGLWAILFGLGIFASWRFLPPAVGWVGAFHIAVGLAIIACGPGDHALSPWFMAVPFGVGQLLAAWVLYHGPRGQDDE